MYPTTEPKILDIHVGIPNTTLKYLYIYIYIYIYICLKVPSVNYNIPSLLATCTYACSYLQNMLTIS